MTSSRCVETRPPGTTPPKRACRSACEETTFDRMCPSSTSAAAGLVAEVSSAEDQECVAGSETGSFHMIRASSRLSV
jgi:hypothetical protein